MKSIAIPLCVVLLMAGCSSQALLGAKCSFERTNNPYAPRSYECLQLDQQQDHEARNRRHENEKKRLEKTQRKARQKLHEEEQERQERAAAYATESAERMDALYQSLESMPNPRTYYEQGDLDSARAAADDRLAHINDSYSWYSSRGIPIPSYWSYQCAVALVTIDWIKLLNREFLSIISNPSARMIDEGASCYDAFYFPQAQALLAHAYMFESYWGRADHIYFTLRGGPEAGFGSWGWEERIAKDFEKLREAGIATPAMDDILSRLASSD